MKGFTMVEIMVVIAITVFLSAMTLVYNRGSEKQLALFKDQAVIVGALNRAKALALQKYKVGTSACAFGVHFAGATRPQSFIIFQDLPTCDNRYTESMAGEKIEELQLDHRVEFVDLEINILFKPPYLETINPQKIVIRLKDKSQVKEIEVGIGGAITSL